MKTSGFIDLPVKSFTSQRCILKLVQKDADKTDYSLTLFLEHVVRSFIIAMPLFKKFSGYILFIY